MQSRQSQDETTTGGARKSYSKPRLHVYGDLGHLTQNVTNMGSMDGAQGKAHGTRV